jgi:uncharacterized protein (TIGR02147 family)
MRQARPDVFTYHDDRLFLVDFCAFLKETQAGFNVAKLAKDSQLSKGYLSMVLSGERKLTQAALEKLMPHLNLSNSEQSYLMFLRELSHAKTQIEKARVIEEMQKLRSYQKTNPKETATYRYLTRWFYVAIRELAALPDFELDAKWIQERLIESVPLGDIEKAIEFLIENGFLTVGPDGKAFPPDKRIECLDQVFRAAMVKYHEQVFGLAIKHVPKLEADRKVLNAHMAAISQESFTQIKQLMGETLAKIIDIAGKDKNPEMIFEFSLLGFALSNPPKKGDAHE